MKWAAYIIVPLFLRSSKINLCTYHSDCRLPSVCCDYRIVKMCCIRHDMIPVRVTIP
jgi:hypothetical protein